MRRVEGPAEQADAQPGRVGGMIKRDGAMGTYPLPLWERVASAKREPGEGSERALCTDSSPGRPREAGTTTLTHKGRGLCPGALLTA